MAFDFNKLKEDLVSVGKDMGNKAKDVSNVAKLKLDIRSKEDFLEKQYAQLGKAYYEAVTKEEGIEEDEYFPSIQEAKLELEKLKEELLDLQGAVECPSCGNKQDKSSAYCSVCGAKLPEEPEPDTVTGDVVDQNEV